MATQTPDYLTAEYNDIAWPDPSGIPDQGSGGGSGYAAQITALYQQYYHRDPTSAELLAWNEQLAKGVPLSTLEGQLKAAAANQQAPTTETPAGWTGAQDDYQGIFNWLFPGESLSPADLKAKEAELAKYGITLAPNAAGVVGKVRLPNGQIIDVIQGAGSGLNRKQWLTGGGEGEDGPPITVDPSYLAPWTREFAFDAWQEPGSFRAPTEQDLYLDPSYKSRMGETMGQLENSAAARGLLNSGGTLYDLAKTSSDFASQEYSQLWNRNWLNWNTARTNARDVWSTNRNNAWQQYLEDKDSWYRNQNEPWSKLFQAGTLGANASA